MAVPVPKGPGFGRARHTRRTLGLSVAFVLYLVMGGVVFHFLETYSREVTTARPAAAWLPLLEYLQRSSTAERWQGPPWDQLKQTAAAQCQEEGRQNVDELLESLYAAVQEARLADQVEDGEEEEEEEEVLATLHPPIGDTTLNQLLLLCGNSSYVLQSEEHDVPWSFIDAIFFCMTVVTTIGYGHISPKTPGGQIFCVVYSLLGIPISGLLLAGLSDFFAGNLLNFYDTKWAKRHGDSKWSLAAFTALYLLVGFVTFVFVPAIFFSWLEDWNYREAVYYAFITLSTIGFGDYTAGISDDTAWMSVYKVVVMIWILIGLGYWVLVLNFLQKTLKSKEVLNTLKSTSRLIAKEADELRATLAEVGLIRRDATFIPEHSKMALNMMLSMSRSLAGTTPSGGGAEGESGSADPLASLRGIHSIGDNMRSHGLLAALLSSMPPPPSSPTQTASTMLTPTSVTAETSVLTGEDELQGRINVGYLSEDDPSSERVTSPEPASDRRRPLTEPAGAAGPVVRVIEPGSERPDAGEDAAVSPSEAASPGCGV